MGKWDEIKALHKATTLGAKEGVAFRYFSRPLASFTLYHIQHGKITPNQVTIASLIVALVGSVVHVSMLGYGGLILGGALFMIAHFLDALDGQLARHRKAGSVLGMYFDFFIDELKAYFVFCSISIRLWRQMDVGFSSWSPTPWQDRWLLHRVLQFFDDCGCALGRDALLFIALAGLAGLSIGISCTEFMKRKEWKDAFVPPGAPVTGGGTGLIGLIEKIGKFIIDYPSYILILCLIDSVEIYFLLYAAIVCLYAVRALFGISRKLWRIDPYKKA